MMLRLRHKEISLHRVPRTTLLDSGTILLRGIHRLLNLIKAQLDHFVSRLMGKCYCPVLMIKH